MDKKLKILYICPFAHYSGHHPHVATVEPERLARSGLDVTLLTFAGIINNTQVKIRHIKVLSPDKHPIIHSILRLVRQRTLPRWILMFIETVMTLNKAARIKRKEGYDILHLRDGEPFLFLSHLVSLPYRGHKWVISSTAAIVFSPKLKTSDFIHRPFVCLYSLFLNIWINSKLWKLLYKHSLKRNQFILVPQNKAAVEAYNRYMGGIFSKHIVCIGCGIDSNNTPNRKESRKHLGIPLDAFVLLSFGAPHSGKDTETIFGAVQLCTDVFLIHGGTHTFSLGDNPVKLTRKYRLKERTKVFNYYIPEEEKPYFFGAANASILSYTKAFASTSSSIWESAKYRLPVIASNANILGEDVAKYKLGLLFEAGNVKSLVETIKLFKELPDSTIAKFKENCTKFINDHSGTKWTRECTAVYRRLMDENS